jgi:hypothetical protein
MSGDTTHTIKYEQPGIFATLPYNKVAQFALGMAILVVVLKAFWAGWFAQFAFAQMEQTLPSDGMTGFGTPFGLIPFVIDAVCLVGLGGFALIAMGRGIVGPVLAGLPQWLARLRGDGAAIAAATEAATGIRTSSGRELTLAEANRYLVERIKKLEAKTSAIPEPEPPPAPKTTEQIMIEQLAAMQAKLDAMETPAPRTTRAKS